jgi:penicillin-binding protein 1A
MLASVVAAFASVAAVARSEIQALPRICDLDEEEVRPLGETSYVYAVDDSFLGAIRANQYRQVVSLEDISPWLQRAAVAMEDRRFYEHDGIDYQAIARAAWRNIEERRIVEGGSTITQQLVLSLYLSRDNSLERKRVEACLALQLEERWSKEQILESYLNRVYFGNLAYGAEAAAQTYFSRRASQLGPAQAALLVGLVQAPSLYDPFRNPERATARRNEVLRAMVETGAIPATEYEGLASLPLNLRRGHLFATQREPYFFEFVRQQLVEEYGEDVVRQGGLRVYTTVFPRNQQLARQAMNAELGQAGDPASAIVAIDPRNGAIRTMTSIVPGSRPDFNLAVQGRRQTGSAFKTFVLAEAIRRGAHPYQTVYVSEPFSHPMPAGQEPWEPKTFDGTYPGPLNLAEATIRSDNVVFAKLTLDLGPASVAQMAGVLGVKTPLQAVPSIGLGANDLSVLEMASAYATLAGNGVYHEPFAIRRVERADGEMDAERWGPSPGQQLVPDAVAHNVTLILEQNVQRGTGTSAQIPGRPAAGKTGTTDRFSDAWFVGYVPQLATAAWVGYPNETRAMTDVRGIRVTGGSFPAAIWGRFMRSATENLPVLAWEEPTTTVPWTRLGEGSGEGDGDD